MRIIIFGPPGAGKGTQAKKIAEYFNIIHLSTGEMFRRAINEKNKLGNQVNSIINNGKLIPDQTVLALVEENLRDEKYNKGYIIDGFPRTVKQAVAFNKLLARRKETLDAFISLQVHEDELIKRLQNRGEGRSDDTDENIKIRLDVYKKKTTPVMTFYKNAGLFRSVDGTGSVDEIFNRILTALQVR
ncbi:MAG: adenylate kinase [Balneolales bacterium]